MSTLQASLADWPATVTPSDTVDDAAGPFAALLITAAGTLEVFPLAGPQRASGLAIPVVAGQYICFPVKRVGIAGTTTATCIGLVSAVVRQGS
jgi:hypothetical protein